MLAGVQLNQSSVQKSKRNKQSELHSHVTINHSRSLQVLCKKRLWEYRGPTGDGDIYHLDLVVVDEQNNAMYAEIPADLIS